MSFTPTGGSQQPMNHPQHQPQQQLFMNPQTENLDQLYSLVGNLVELIQENKKHKSSILSKVDTLSSRINRDPEKRRENYEGDMAVFQNFINGSIGSYSTSGRLSKEVDQIDIGCSADENEDAIVQRQNMQLRTILEEEQKLTLRSVKELSYHEGGFHDIIRALRCDVLNHRKLVLDITKRKFHKELTPKEDEEFFQYMDNIDNFDQLLRISEIFRTLLMLLNS